MTTSHPTDLTESGAPCASAYAAADDAAEALNMGCHCISLDREALCAEIVRLAPQPALCEMLRESHPNLFAEVAVFVGQGQLARMRETIAAVEDVVAMPEYQETVLARSPQSARHKTAARSVFMGYDFHLSADGPQLIEINTNAGGALLNATLARAQRACCREVAERLADLESSGDDGQYFDMFLAEWRLARGDAPLRTIVIVDEHPAGQFLYPEFLLFQELFARHGLDARIADIGDLVWTDGRLEHDGAVVDLVYNRHTDFSLDRPESAALRQAWLADGAVITPHPRAHALYADKRNLALLSDEALLARWGVAEAVRTVLRHGIPRTVAVSADNADGLWAQRREWFFKPAAGFGSRAAYRGDKLTRRVFGEILAGDYVAQRIVLPTRRRLDAGDGQQGELKVDLRNYTYAGNVQLVAARLYEGQTTNFRTAGGGFAPVVAV